MTRHAGPQDARTPLRLAFAGTPPFAATILQALLDAARDEVVAVYTQPDRGAGRGRRTRPGAVKALAAGHGLPVHQPASLRGETVAAELAALEPDVLVVAAYGLLLPGAVLETPRLGCLNVHASLLPRWRGAAPVQRALLAGDERTGITIMRMTRGLDSGPLVLQRACPIEANDTAGTLAQRLATLGGECLLEALEAAAAGTLVAEPQDETRVTYAPKIAPDEAHLDWRRPAAELERCVRAFNPRPGATLVVAGRELKVWAAEALATPASREPGTVLAAGATGIDVATGAGVLRLRRVQAPGRRPVAAAAYVNAVPELRARG